MAGDEAVRDIIIVAIFILLFCLIDWSRRPFPVKYCVSTAFSPY